jgi:hypothetical protein
VPPQYHCHIIAKENQMRPTLSAAPTALGAFFIVTVALMLASPAMAQDSSNVRSIGQWPYGVNYATAFFEIGANDYALIGSGSMLVVINVNTPASPVKVGEIRTPGIIRGLAVSGTYAYVADGLAGLRVINLSTPASPVEAGFYDTPGNASGLAVSGNYAYVADADSGLRIIDVSDPAAPFEAGYYSRAYPVGVAVAGSYAYLAGPSQICIIDISDPASPDSIGSLDLTVGGNCWGTGVAVSGNYAYVSVADSGLWVINVSNPSAPAHVGSCNTPGRAYGVSVSGSYVYLSDGPGGMEIINVSSPASPYIEGICGGLGETYAVALTAFYVYAAVNGCGLQVIENLGPDIPQEIAVYVTPGRSRAVAVSGNYAYLSYLGYGIEILDVSDPGNPAHVSYFKPNLSSSDPYQMAVSGNYAYLADGIYGLRILNVTNPASPSQTGYLNTSGTAYDVVLRDSLAFIADGSQGLRVIDVSNPAAPADVGGYNTLGTAYAVAISGNYAFVADGYQGVKIIDISIPTTPAQVAAWDSSAFPMNAVDIVVNGNYAYVAWGGSGLVILDVSTPTNPVFVGVYNPYSYHPYDYSNIIISGANAYVTTGWNNLRVINISDPLSLAEAGFYTTPQKFNAVALSGDYLYVTTDEIDLQICQQFGPKVPALLTPADNSWLASDTAFCTWSIGGKKAKDSQVYYVLKAYQLPDTINPVGTSNTIGFADTMAVSEGRYRWQVTAHDLAGNPPGISGYFYFGYDTTAPQIQYVKELSDDSSAPYGPYEVTGKVYDLNGVKNVWLFRQVNGGSWDSTAMVFFADSLRDTIPQLYPITDETLTVSYLIKAIDMADHQSNSSLHSFKVIGPLGVAGNPPMPLPAVYALYGSYPNPSRGKAIFKYQTPKESPVRLEIYNVAGQLIKTFDEGRKPAGYHQINWNGSPANGVYFYRLKAGLFVGSGKMTVIR